MHPVVTIAKDQWRYWYRSKIAAVIMMIAFLLTLASSVLTYLSIDAANHQRLHLQHQSEAAFLEQPDRHPHRMVHYGHYVFRAPAPLGTIDPGVDAYTGSALFLEGHRQNSAMFSGQQQSSGLARFGQLTPAFVMQILIPLLLILVGYSAVSREREAETLSFILSQGTSACHFILGKLLALVLVGSIFILPLIVAALFSLKKGESLWIVASFVGAYLAYVFIWCAIVTVCSCWCRASSSAFIALISIWLLVCLLLPRIAVSTAASIEPSVSKLETDFEVLKELRKLGDGHNASDPAFNQLKKNLLAQYKVDSVDQLPLNFRGMVAQQSEAELTKVLNTFSDQRLNKELNQAYIARNFGWLSPTIALRTTSMMLSGTNLETHHRFLREAEKVRFAFVQGLNKLHETELDYHADINRYKDAHTQQKARVAADHWQLLSQFRFAVAGAQERLESSLCYALQLLFGISACIGLLMLSRRAL